MGKVRKTPDHGILGLVHIDKGAMLRVESPTFKDRAEAWRWLKAHVNAPGEYMLVRFLESHSLEVVSAPHIILEQVPLFGSKG